MDEEFDYIVVGAGSAGCIVASRLTEDPSICVLLVEAGGSDQSPIIAMPGALPFATRASGSGGATSPVPSRTGVARPSTRRQARSSAAPPRSTR